ncbi:MAG: hypothetical protein AAGD14_03295 [Planctomycetota bacterium]
MTQLEVDLLSEDVFDLTAIAFQAGENAYLGDSVSPGDITEAPVVGNGFAVTYDLPPAFRLGFGPGIGRVKLSVKEDGRILEDPLTFEPSTSTALDVEITYEIDYEGETLGGRPTDVALTVSLIGSRVSALEPFFNRYRIAGDCFLGATSCVLFLEFEAVGVPSNFVPGIADASGEIDDPDVRDIYELDYDFAGDGFYFAEGWVGCCAFFRERFTIP